jgi:hypothetical protein
LGLYYLCKEKKAKFEDKIKLRGKLNDPKVNFIFIKFCTHVLVTYVALQMSENVEA